MAAPYQLGPFINPRKSAQKVIVHICDVCKKFADKAVCTKCIHEGAEQTTLYNFYTSSITELKKEVATLKDQLHTSKANESDLTLEVLELKQQLQKEQMDNKQAIMDLKESADASEAHSRLVLFEIQKKSQHLHKLMVDQSNAYLDNCEEEFKKSEAFQLAKQTTDSLENEIKAAAVWTTQYTMIK